MARINNPSQVSILVEAQATYYPTMISVYIPKEPIVKHGEGYEKPTRTSSFRLEDDSDAIKTETNIERSIRRTKKFIRDYVLCNDFELFITFTFKSDRQNITKIRKQMRTWLKNQRDRNGKFRYIIIPELHNDGKSLHFHALFGDYPGKLSQAINPKTNKPLIQKGKVIYMLDGYTLGFNNAKLISTDDADRAKISSYIQKYITKDMPTFSNKNRYWVSSGLVLPRVEDNPEKWYLHVKPDWSKEFENGTLLRFNIHSNVLVDIFWEANY